MIHKNCFQALDKPLRDVLRDDGLEPIEKPFRGKTFVLGGDLGKIYILFNLGQKLIYLMHQ